MQTQNLSAAHSLYVLYETLSDETQQLFLQELLAKQKNKLESLLSLKSETLKGFETSWQEMLRGEYQPVDTLWDDIEP
jgi:hypothetical protein